MKHIDEIYRGSRLALRLGTMEKVIDYLEVCKLNDVSANAWIRGNNSGNNDYMKKMDKKADKAYMKASVIAEKNKWDIDHTAGLYWEIRDCNGRIE